MEAQKEPQQDKISAAKELFHLVETAVKTLNLYEGKGESCDTAVSKAFDHLKTTVDRFGELTVSVRPFELLMEDQRVYSTEEDRKGITYRIFRDGIRKVGFLPQIDRREFLVLLEMLRAIRQATEENDSVTELWEQNLSGIKYEAVDYFLEGSIAGSGGDPQGRIEELLGYLRRPLHGRPHTDIAGKLRERLNADIVEQARQKRAECFYRLRQQARASGSISAEAIGERRAEMPMDLWRRSMALITRLLDAGGSAVPDLLVQIIEQLMLAERWEALQTSCQILDKQLKQSKSEAGAALPSKLEQALGELCTENKLLALYEALSSCSSREFEGLAGLIRILPEKANPQLMLLLRRLPSGEIQERMLKLLSGRGADLTDFYRQRLRSQNPDEVTAAIQELGKVGVGSAIAALKAVTGHEDPAIRLQVFRALGDHVGESLAPRLIESLRFDHPELRELCISLLERIDGRRQGDRLLAVFKTGLADGFSPDQQQRGLGMLVRWGGEEADQFVVAVITAKNLFRRSDVESEREKMLRAVGDAGGERARALLERCLQERMPRRVRDSVEQALQVAKTGGPAL